MTLKEQIDRDFKEAYLNRDMSKKNFLGVLKGQIQTQEGKLIPSTDENVLKVIKSFEKSINEVLLVKQKHNQPLETQLLELSYIKPYLPQQMSEEEIVTILSEIINRPNVNKNQGVLMGLFNKEQKGKAFDNKTVSKIIMQLIT